MVSVKSPGLAPPTLGDTVKGDGLPLVMVKDWGALAELPRGTLPKSKELGLTLTTPMPVPLREALASAPTASDAVLAPALNGAKATDTVQLSPGCSIAGQGPMLKSAQSA